MPKSSSGSSNLRNNLMREMIAPQSALDSNPKAKLLTLDKIVSNPFQVRQDFSSSRAVSALEELAQDIQQRGVLQPLVVRPVSVQRESGGGYSNRFEIVAGERRFRAAQLAGLQEVPVIIEEMNDTEAQMASLTENLQRLDLGFREEVDFLAEINRQRTLLGKGGDTDLAQVIHKSRTYVAKRLKLANYPDLLEKVEKAELSINQAYELAVGGGNNKSETTSENPNNVFPGNTNGEAGETAPDDGVVTANPTLSAQSSNKSFKVKLVSFSRLSEAVSILDKEVNVLGQQDRDRLKQEVEQLGEKLSQLLSKLETLN